MISNESQMLLMVSSGHNEDLVLIFDEGAGSLQVGFNHLRDEGVEVDLALPAQNTFGLSRVSKEESVRIIGVSERERVLKVYILDFGRSEVSGINLDKNLAGVSINTLLVDSSASPPVENA